MTKINILNCVHVDNTCTCTTIQYITIIHLTYKKPSFSELNHQFNWLQISLISPQYCNILYYYAADAVTPVTRSYYLNIPPKVYTVKPVMRGNLSGCCSFCEPNCTLTLYLWWGGHLSCRDTFECPLITCFTVHVNHITDILYDII